MMYLSNGLIAVLALLFLVLAPLRADYVILIPWYVRRALSLLCIYIVMCVCVWGGYHCFFCVIVPALV